MSIVIPDGYFCDDHMVFGNLGKGGIVAKGYTVDFPDLSASDDEQYITLESDLRLILGCLSADERLQLQVYTSSDFSKALDRYECETKKSSIEICSNVRAELASRFRDRMAAETLIQSSARLYVSSKLPAFVKEGSRMVRGFKETFHVIRRAFEQRALFFDMLLRGQGGSVTPLDDTGHYREILKLWAPAQVRVWNPPAREIDWLRTISDLCLFSDLAPRHPPECGFHLDGHVFGVLVYRTMPRSTWMKTMQAFQALTIPGLRITLNMQPLPIEKELLYEEDRFSKLMSNIDPQNPSLQSEVGLDKHRERCRRLMTNDVLPFRCQIIVLVSGKARDGVDAKLESIRVAIGKSGAESYQVSVPTSALSFFNACTPGFGPWVPYRDFWHKIDDLNLSNLWPAGSTPCADLDTADWIADGDQNNLIGSKCFIGAQPAHLLVKGNTGSGKSTLMQTVVIQSAPQFRFIVVVDDGLSWQSTCRKLDPSCHSIIVKSNGEQTFNPFDTRGQPLSAQHLASATALCHLLVGSHSDQDKDKLRAAVLTETISEIYGVAYRSWRNKNPEDHFLLAPDLDDSPASEEYRLSIAFSHWTPAMFPTLSDLQDELHTAALQRGPHQELCATLASLLRPWLRDGRYGPIVDGASNVDLGSSNVSDSDPLKVVHFELGEMGQSEAELKAVVGFLITNEVRNHIQGMPRGVRKQVIIEEMTSFLKVPNAEQIVVDYYERMRKYSCQVVSVFQQYSSLLAASPKVAKAIIGNSSQMLLLRNHNRKDLETLDSFVHIPEVIKDKIVSFPMPESMKGRADAYAGFVLVNLEGPEPRFTVGRNYISQAVEDLTTSSGDQFERKQLELKYVRNHQENIAGRNGNQPFDAGRLRERAEIAEQPNR